MSMLIVIIMNFYGITITSLEDKDLHFRIYFEMTDEQGPFTYDFTLHPGQSHDIQNITAQNRRYVLTTYTDQPYPNQPYNEANKRCDIKFVSSVNQDDQILLSDRIFLNGVDYGSYILSMEQITSYLSPTLTSKQCNFINIHNYTNSPKQVEIISSISHQTYSINPHQIIYKACYLDQQCAIVVRGQQYGGMNSKPLYWNPLYLQPLDHNTIILGQISFILNENKQNVNKSQTLFSRYKQSLEAEIHGDQHFLQITQQCFKKALVNIYDLNQNQLIHQIQIDKQDVIQTIQPTRQIRVDIRIEKDAFVYRHQFLSGGRIFNQIIIQNSKCLFSKQQMDRVLIN